MTSFSNSLNARGGKLATNQAASTRFDAFANHLTDISGEASGTPLRDYLSAAVTSVCEDFLAEMRNRRNHRDYTDPDELIDLTMQKKSFGRKTWKRPANYHTGGFERALTMRETWRGRGYAIGKLAVENLVPRPPVMLCEDGELRVRRDADLFTPSYGEGYGRLPDRNLGIAVHVALPTEMGRRPGIGTGSELLPEDVSLANYLAKIVFPDPPQRALSQYK